MWGLSPMSIYECRQNRTAKQTQIQTNPLHKLLLYFWGSVFAKCAHVGAFTWAKQSWNYTNELDMFTACGPVTLTFLQVDMREMYTSVISQEFNLWYWIGYILTLGEMTGIKPYFKKGDQVDSGPTSHPIARLKQCHQLLALFRGL